MEVRVQNAKVGRVFDSQMTEGMSGDSDSAQQETFSVGGIVSNRLLYKYRLRIPS